MFCKYCSKEIDDGVRFCPYCGMTLATGVPPLPADIANRRLVAGLLGILLGGWGIHKFYLGFTGAGILQIVLTFATCGLFGIVGLIEGIIYLTKNDTAFYQDYIVNQKNWF